MLNHSQGIITKIENWAISKEYTRRDGDWNRLLAFVKTLDYTRSKYWEKKYPQNYYLALLATHPDYRRRGAGTALTQWGMEKALAEGFDVGLEASPMGFPVYKHLGFEFLEEVVVQVEGDDAKISLKVMVYEGKGKLFGENEEEKKLSGDWV
jgi:GNAT superfamily N-acetyltransferase